jgi:hypothetical protein
MKQLLFSCVVDTPDDLFQSAEIALKIKPAWDDFVKALKAAKVGADAKVEQVTTPTPRKPRTLRKTAAGAVVSEPAVEAD